MAETQDIGAIILGYYTAEAQGAPVYHSLGHRPTAWDLGQAQGEYNDLFWRPYLGAPTYGLWQAMAAAVRAVAAGWMEQPTIEALADTAGLGRHALLGRAATRTRPAQAGLLARLEGSWLARRHVVGKGRRRQYSLGVLLSLPALTPAQATGLPARLQVTHERYLGALRGFDLPAWRHIEAGNLAPDLVDLWGWAWLGQPPTPYRATGRPELPEMIRRSVLARDAYHCRYCGRPASEVSHIIPWGQGGGNDAGNLAAACPDCLARIGNRTPAQASLILRS